MGSSQYKSSHLWWLVLRWSLLAFPKMQYAFTNEKIKAKQRLFLVKKHLSFWRLVAPLYWGQPRETCRYKRHVHHVHLTPPGPPQPPPPPISLLRQTHYRHGTCPSPVASQYTPSQLCLNVEFTKNLVQHCLNVGLLMTTQLTQNISKTLVQCWSSVEDVVADVVQMLCKCFVFAGNYIVCTDLFTNGLMLDHRHGPDGSFASTGACNLRVRGSNPDRDGYLSSWLCIYTVPQTVQRPGVYSALYNTVNHKEPLKSFEIRVGFSHTL